MRMFSFLQSSDAVGHAQNEQQEEHVSAITSSLAGRRVGLLLAAHRQVPSHHGARQQTQVLLV